MPPADDTILLEEPAEEWFSLYRDLLEESDRYMKRVFIPARFLHGDLSSEAWCRPVQGGEKSLEHLLQVVGALGREHE